ncbi:tyrosinase family oxidase copper chaperone [Streptomyces melanogenes]|uniref:Tyrosinase cofactor n=1 Tax=Streptomyces melanogenes TaxID=67326 RepID=A0ABZ1XKC2_9ACTN|nr:tyrosinase family oxidase copper chaperone [Streptomyces melanogenes]
MLNRRDVIKRGAVAATVATGLAGAAGVAVYGARDDGSPVTAAARSDDHTETYKGRTIQVTRAGADHAVSIDGKPLHLMKLGEGAYLSALCHYEVAKTPLHAARAAVDELHGANLVPLGDGSHHSM